ncbi:MAG: MarR family transcriptional regulator [Methanomicrobiaceae archaeon]|nr:MarR family transcriptional regulator [Methanomicrobiaceae archaeon]
MREEDLDWDVYHIIAMNGHIAMDELVAISNQPGNVIADSVARLERRFLIARTGVGVRVLSVQESIARCQLQSCMDDRLVMENGVIKVRPEAERDSR